MWMMGYNEGGQADFNMPDSFNGRKLRPLIPRPLASAATNNPSSTTPCLSRIHGSHDFITQYHHLAAMAEQNKRSEFINTPQVVVSSRWNPTPEQLRALEELYRRGTRTPSAEQIQHITAQLRRYGKIEGKNVFYWFQNHKARERQKRRRQLESSAPSAPDHDQPLQISMSTDHHQNKESLGGSRTGFEVEEIKNWPPSTNCTTTLAQDSAASMQRAAKAADQCCRTDGWIQFDEEELQQRRNFVETNATWQMMQLSCPPHPHRHRHRHPPTHLINTNPTAAAASTITNTSTTVLTTTSSRDQRLIKTHHDLSIFMEPYKSPSNHPNHNTNSNNIIQQDHGCGESQTLQLFPLRSGGGDVAKELSTNHKDSELSSAHPYPFFEFLPLKN